MPRPIVTAEAAQAALYDVTERPDVPLDEAPPGLALHELDSQAQHLALIGLDGLAAQIRAKAQACRAGSQGYHDLHHLLGRITTAAAVLRRHLAAEERRNARGKD